MRKVWGLVAVFWLLPITTYADIELRGLLLNDTRTFAGQAFYRAFIDQWQIYDTAGQYNLVISERPSARTGSQIQVRYGDKVLFQRFIHFNPTRAEKAGKEATGIVFERVTQEEVNQLFPDPDLGPDEIKLN